MTDKPHKHNWIENVHMRMCQVCRQEDYNVNYGIKGRRPKWVLVTEGKPR